MRGLDTFPKADRTPLAPYVRLAFIGMVGIGTGLVALSLWYWLRRRRGTSGPEDRLTLMAIGAAGPAAFLANELGWLVSELGRQPWIVYGVFRTSSGITTAPGLGATFTAFTLLYVGLTVAHRLERATDRRPARRGPALAQRWRPPEMSLPAVIAVLLGVSLTAYAIFAGADFGAGSPRPPGRRARDADREAIAATIGPLWEANHVWLIFSITILFSAFPAAFSALGTALLAPFTVALLAIVLRSVALGPARRAPAGAEPQPGAARPTVRSGQRRRAVRVRGRGRRTGAVVSRALRRCDRAVPAIPWHGPVGAGRRRARGGALRPAGRELRRAQARPRLGEDRITERFRRRGLQSGACVLLLSVVALAAASATAPALSHRLIGAGATDRDRRVRRRCAVAARAGAPLVRSSPAAPRSSPAPPSCGAGSSPRRPTWSGPA